MSATIHTVRSVWSDEDDAPILVQPGEVSGVRVCSRVGDDYWGKFDFTMTNELARMLAKAIIDCCNEGD